jgi:hypothetical protein
VRLESSINLSAHAVFSADHRLRIVLINKDAQHAVTVRIQSHSVANKADLLRLSAPSLYDHYHITFGATAVSADGIWQAQQTESVPVSNGELSVFLPAGSAVLATLGD